MGSWAVRASHSTATLRDLPQSSQCPPSGHGAMSARIGSLGRRPTVAMTCGRRPGHQATTVRSAAPPTFASGSESCPKPLGPKFVGFAPQVFRVRACDHLSSPSDDSRFPRANGGEHCAASATQTAASAALPTQRERRRAPRCQRNANGGEHRAASAKRTAANTAQPEQRERRRTPRSQCNANGGEHCAASATQTAASAALPTQCERRRAPRSQCNANGGGHCGTRAVPLAVQHAFRGSAPGARTASRASRVNVLQFAAAVYYCMSCIYSK
ncbi:hypothetical protein BC826DRAFT_1177754 [Russula brevipes]|nr:hypothetical protein BC826DRAFT_1177754 [Russula brevipes]